MLPAAPPLRAWSPFVITATDLELRAGSRVLVSGATLRVQPGDRIGLVGRNGAGKTTSMRVLAGEGEPYAGTVTSNSPIGYLPQDPREGDLSITAKDRVLSARGLDELLRKMEKAQTAMAELVDGPERDKAVREYGRLEERFAALGGYAAESDAARICSASLATASSICPNDWSALTTAARPSSTRSAVRSIDCTACCICS